MAIVTIDTQTMTILLQCPCKMWVEYIQIQIYSYVFMLYIQEAILHCCCHSDYWPLSIGFVCRQKRSINWFHAGGACEGAHQPVVYTLTVIGVHARQKPQQIPHGKLIHTNHTSERQPKKMNDIMMQNEVPFSS